MAKKKYKSYLPQPVSCFVHDCVGNIFAKRGFFESRIVTDWHIIVGEKFAKFSYPKKLSFPSRKKKEAVLYIAVSNSSISMNMEYIKDIIIEKISVYFGVNFIKSVKILQYPGLANSFISEDKIVTNVEISLDKKKKLDGLVESIEDEDLREILFSLGSSIL